MAIESRADALLPPEMAVRAEDVGVRKAHLDAPSTFVLAILAGAIIALGAVFSTTVTAGGDVSISWASANITGPTSRFPPRRSSSNGKDLA
jgi:formate/nitrite transporter FocA (FNT family)